MSYKDDFKRREMEHELLGEDEDMLKDMSPEERKRWFKTESEALAKRYENEDY